MMIYVGIVITVILTFLILYDVLQICQQNHYHYSFIRKYFVRSIKNYDILTLIIIGLKIFFESINNIFLSVSIYVISIIYVFIWLRRKRIIKLKFTMRVYRIILVVALLCLIECLFLNYNLIYVFCGVNVLAALFILKPIEMLISSYYVRKAQKKLKEINPLIIGITGSAGKTSVKNYLYDLLKDEKVTFKSPKSYNTINGLSKAINEDLKLGTEVVILEYGASRKNDIKKLVKFIKPDIALVTNVLPQHLETFKCVENIMEEKFKLLKASDVSILNTDIIDTILPDKIKKIRIGSKKNVDYRIEDCVINASGCSFKINGTKFTSSLLGKCNCENLLLAISICFYLGMNPRKLVLTVKNIKSVENRLEIKDIVFRDRKIKIINDSFNSNVKGFKNALEVLNYFEGRKVVITPGIVEGGKNKNDINSLIARGIIGSKTDVYLTKSNVIKYFVQEFENSGYSYSLYERFELAFNEAKENYDIILIENDISDIYKY